MFKSHTNMGFHDSTLNLFAQMHARDVAPDEYSFTFVLKSCAKACHSWVGKMVHCFAVKSGFGSSHFVGTGLIGVYAFGGGIRDARKVFDEMPARNCVTWTAIVEAYVAVGDLEGARELFEMAGDRDVVLWNVMISGYLKAGKMEVAQSLFDRMEGRDLMCWNTMLHGYASGSDLETCVKFFEKMPERNVFSWNGLIAGYIAHDYFSQALRVFSYMVRESDIKPNEATFVRILSACSKLGALDFGRWVHRLANEHGFGVSTNVCNGIIDMYSRCGSIDDAIKVFGGMAKRDVITWNVMIGGYAMHGFGLEALNIFEEMKGACQTPDGITFVGLLNACSHMGLLSQGFAYFRLMINDYNITPWIEHYGCMVDLLARAGFVHEALQLTRSTPMEADQVIWTSLLSACQTHKNTIVGEVVVKELTKLQPCDAASYVALSNIYGSVGRWKDAAKAKQMMRKKSDGKVPGCSLIELDSEVAVFYSLDVRHPKAEEIFRVLGTLFQVSKMVWTGTELDFKLQEI